MPLLKLVVALVQQIDEKLYRRLKTCLTNEIPAFALPWMLTWLSHEMMDVVMIERVFDYFICSHPIAPVYVSTVVFANRSCIVVDYTET